MDRETFQYEVGKIVGKDILPRLEALENRISVLEKKNETIVEQPKTEIPKNGIKIYAKGKGRKLIKWTPEIKEKIIELYKDDYTVKEITKTINEKYNLDVNHGNIANMITKIRKETGLTHYHKLNKDSIDPMKIFRNDEESRMLALFYDMKNESKHFSTIVSAIASDLDKDESFIIKELAKNGITKDNWTTRCLL